MAIKDYVSPTKFSEFLAKCKALFASQQEVDANTLDINDYLLDIDYESELAFDTTEVVQKE